MAAQRSASDDLDGYVLTPQQLVTIELAERTEKNLIAERAKTHLEVVQLKVDLRREKMRQECLEKQRLQYLLLSERETTKVMKKDTQKAFDEVFAKTGTVPDVAELQDDPFYQI